MNHFKSASQAEILRAVQKDESFIDSLSRSVSNLCLELLGPRVWIRYKWLSEPSSRILYFLITTCSDYQTLGEEYTGIVQTDTSQRRVPSKLTRFVMVLLQSFGPIFLKNLVKRWKSKVLEVHGSSSDRRQKIEIVFTAVEKTLSFVEKLNVCLFYLNGVYYHVSKRLTGVNYVKYSGLTQPGDSTRATFKTLGLVAGAHLILSTLFEYNKTRHLISRSSSCADNNKKSSVRGVGGGHRCPLCLEELGSGGVVSVTECGHLFCWTCIITSVRSSPVCPLCRQTLHINKIIPIRNI